MALAIIVRPRVRVFRTCDKSLINLGGLSRGRWFSVRAQENFSFREGEERVLSEDHSDAQRSSTPSPNPEPIDAPTTNGLLSLGIMT
jgi:hypothetical protein